MPVETLAVIPARGGSKGVPRKNLRLLAGKPLVAHSIEQALSAEAVSRVVVSTEDPEIALTARRYGAEVIDRPLALSQDHSSSESALLHVLEVLRQAEAYEPARLAFLQCTSPLLLAEDIDAIFAALEENQADSALSASRFHGFLWRQAGSEHVAAGINHDQRVRERRQDREPQFHENGAVYAMRTAGFVAAGHRFFGKTILHEMPAERSLEIDSPLDFEIAEVVCRRRQQAALSRFAHAVQAVVLDFDGVFTDNKVIVFQDGTEAVVCDRGDGWGLARLRDLGLPLLVLSGETNPVVAARCRKLRIDCQHGVADKLPALTSWAAAHGVSLEQVAYVGNDLNDLECLNAVGCAVAVGDAVPEVKAAAHVVLNNSGGKAAIREVADLVAQGRAADGTTEGTRHARCG